MTKFLANKKMLKVSLQGEMLLNSPRLNKGSAFSIEERRNFNLMALLPDCIETLECQADRAWNQVNSYSTPLQKNTYLMELHNTNETLFYELIKSHLEELLPVIYTPTVGMAVTNFSAEIRKPLRALHLSYENIKNIDDIFARYSKSDIRVIVVTDGERVLGLGDQGIGGVFISVAKLMLYSLFAGLNPVHTLPIVLDIGTNNPKLLNNPYYLGEKTERLAGKFYDDFIANFVIAVKKYFPKALLHWEDFGKDNAYKNLKLYRNQICSFNDDIQGTGVVTLAAIVAALKALRKKLSEQRIVILGAGSAGIGIAEQIYNAILRSEKIVENTARKCFWFVDKNGLITNNTINITTEQKLYVRDIKESINWNVNDINNITLLEVVKNVKPTILIGCSGVGRIFTQEIIQTMSSQVEHPIILPLSNPTTSCEAVPEDLIKWTNGKALIATGSPFASVEFSGRKVTIAQCNNALVFPGLGFGAIIAQAQQLTDNLLWTACEELYKEAPILQNINEPLLPPITKGFEIARKIIFAVANKAISDGLAKINKEDIEKNFNELYWEPVYLLYKYSNCEKSNS